MYCRMLFTVVEVPLLFWKVICYVLKGLCHEIFDNFSFGLKDYEYADSWVSVVNDYTDTGNYFTLEKVQN